MAAALELIDARGLPALSMRTLGRALGTSAMALYFHYPSKEELLGAVGRQLVSSVPALTPPSLPSHGAVAADPRALASAILGQLRAVHALHRNAYELVHAELGREEAMTSWVALWPRLSKERADLLRITLVAVPWRSSASPALDAELLELFFG